MTDDAMAGAVAQLARDMSEAWGRFAEALGGADILDSGPTGGRLLPAINDKTPLRERLKRQALILNEIANAPGGNVPQATFHEIARKYGYSGRGTAGFFNRGGLLEMRGTITSPAGIKVHLTKQGKDRLKAHRDQVDAFLEQQKQIGELASA